MADRWIGQWVAGSRAAVAECLTGQQLVLVSFFLRANEKKVGRPSWLDTRIDFTSPPPRPFFCLGALLHLWDSLLDFFFWRMWPPSVLSSMYSTPSWDPFCSRPFLGRLHLTCLQNQQQNTQSSGKRGRASGPGISEGGWMRGSRVHPITDSNEVKYSPANGGTRQWNGRVQSCSESPPRPPLLSSQVC